MIQKEKRIKEIDQEIFRLKKMLSNEKFGTKTEVYTRIVGYFRNIGNWNKGKKSEYKDRVTFVQKNIKKVEKEKIIDKKNENIKKISNKIINKTYNEMYYKFFFSSTCSKCIPFKKNIQSNNGEYVNISIDDNIEQAKKYNILSVPTIIFFENIKTEREIVRCNTVEKLNKIMEYYNGEK